MEYRQFIERNEHEGETWHFYIPVEGNEEALIEFGAMKIDGGDFHLRNDKIFSAEEVSIIEENDSMGGYLPRHNRLEGKLDLTDIRKLGSQELHDYLYKGGIRNLVVPNGQ